MAHADPESGTVNAVLEGKCAAAERSDGWVLHYCHGRNMTEARGKETVFMSRGAGQPVGGSEDTVLFLGGDLCLNEPNKPARQVLAHFMCSSFGVDDAPLEDGELGIVEVKEAQTCKYDVVVVSPSLCNDTRFKTWNATADQVVESYEPLHRPTLVRHIYVGRYGVRRFRPLTPEEIALRRKASTRLLLLVGFMVVAQILIFCWKQAHYKSFQYVTLFGAWTIPFVVSVRQHWWRFVALSLCYTVAMSYFVRLAFKRPLPVTAPRQVYTWFNRLWVACYFMGCAGYGLLLFEMSGLRAAFFLPPGTPQVAILVLFYGLYFGVLSRDMAEICSWHMNCSMGYSKKDDDEPQRVLPNNICALCGLDLDPELEHVLEGQHCVPSGPRGGFYDDPLRSRPRHGQVSGPLATSMVRERVVKLKCGHEFHEFCVRWWSIVGKQSTCPNCGDRVDIQAIVGQSPWLNKNLMWCHLLDMLRYLLVWNPVIVACVQLSAYEMGVR